MKKRQKALMYDLIWYFVKYGSVFYIALISVLL